MLNAKEEWVPSMKILPTITTITLGAWKEKVKEVKKLKIKEIALFLTSLKQEERKELYQLLKETSVERIPFVHLRSDMEMWELDYLVDNYQTKVFNAHSEKKFPLSYNLDKYRNIIYIENTYDPLDEKEIKEFAGICLDLSHLENDRIFRQEKYRHNIELIEKYPCGCSHISPGKNFATLNKKNKSWPEDPHDLKNLSELDYLKRYPLKYFGGFVAIEMENSIKEQLKIKDYIMNLLNF